MDKNLEKNLENVLQDFGNGDVNGIIWFLLKKYTWLVTSRAVMMLRFVAVNAEVITSMMYIY